jgi:DNA-binding response OmpR family regulator
VTDATCPDCDAATEYLERDGFRVQHVTNGDVADVAGAGSTDVVILDTGPGVDQLAVLSEVRRRSDVPVIMLSSRSGEADRVVGLELGADDYVVKPLSPRELVARVRSVLRRARPTAPRCRLVFDGLSIDLDTREVVVAGRGVETTAREFDLLAFLAASPRQVFSRGQLLQHVWDSSIDFQDPSTVTVHVRRLRLKIETDPKRPRWITTVVGVGYRFEP